MLWTHEPGENPHRSSILPLSPICTWKNKHRRWCHGASVWRSRDVTIQRWNVNAVLWRHTNTIYQRRLVLAPANWRKIDIHQCISCVNFDLPPLSIHTVTSMGSFYCLWITSLSSQKKPNNLQVTSFPCVCFLILEGHMLFRVKSRRFRRVSLTNKS